MRKLPTTHNERYTRIAGSPARRSSDSTWLASGAWLVFSVVALCLSGFASAESYTYDAIGRLTTVTHDDGSSIKYEYDNAGNVLRIAHAVLAFPPDGVIDTPESDVTITEGASVNFTATSADPDAQLPLAWRWDFDGAADDSNEEDPGDVVFSATGTYEVEFHVTDAAGLTDPTPARRTITVEVAATGGGSSGSNTGGSSEGSNNTNAAAEESGGGGSDGWLLAMLVCLLVLRSRLRRHAPSIALVLLSTGSLNAQTVDVAQWSTMESGVDVDINDIWGTASDNVFAVGDGGTIVHFDGTNWSPMVSGTSEHLQAVYGYGASDVFAIGDGATILHFDGNTWSPFPIPFGETNGFVDLWTAGPGTDLYVITSRLAYRYDGTQWNQRAFSDAFSAFLSPDTVLQGISGSGQYTMVVGRPFSASGGALYVNFTDTDPASSTIDLKGAFGISESEMYIVGGGSHRMSNGNPRNRGDWRRVDPMQEAVDVWGSSASDVFAVGTHFSGTRGYVTHYDGNPDNLWTTSIDMGGVFMTAVWGFSPTDVFAVGQRGTIIRYAEGDPLLTAANYPHSGWMTGNVNAYTGEQVIDNVDFDLGGNIPVIFGRYYASNLKNTLPIGGRLGRNWSHSYEWRLQATADSVRIHTPQGRRIEFSLNAGEWQLDSDHDVEYRLQAILSSSDPASSYYLFMDPESRLTYRFFANTGRLSQIRDRIGNFLNIQYVGNFDPPVFITDNRGRGLTLQYDANTQLVSVTASGGITERRVEFGYLDGNLVSVTDPMGASTRYTYTAQPTDGRIESVQLPNGDVPVTWAFGADGKVASESYADGTSSDVFQQTGTSPAEIVLPDGSVQDLLHDDLGRLVTFTDADGFQQIFAYAAAGMATIEDRLGFVTTMEYSPDNHELLSITSASGRVTGYRYTPAVVDGFEYHDLTAIDYPDGTTKTLERGTNGLINAMVDRVNKRWQLEHDASGNLTRAVSPDGHATSMTYNQNNTLASIDDLAGNRTELRYDSAMRLAVVQHPGAERLTRQYSYDLNNRLTAITNEAGQTTTVGYNANGKIETIDAPMLAPITQTYDELGRLATTTSPGGDVFKTTYDRVAREVTFTDPMQHVEKVVMDKLGRAAGFVQGNRPNWGMKYDAEGVTESFDMPDQKSFQLEDDGNPHGLITAATLNGQTSRVEYDEDGRVTGFVDSEGNRTTQEFNDPRGRISKILLQDPVVSSRFEFDDFGNITLIEDPNGGRWERSYDEALRLSEMSDPLGQVSAIRYNERNQISHVVFPGGLGEVTVEHHPLGFDTQRRYSDGTSLNYDYDDLGRLAGGTGFYLGYDGNGNIEDSNGIAMTYDAADRLETMELAPGKSITYVYDDRNMVIGIRDWTGDAISFEHDAVGRVSGINRANGVATTLQYDPQGQLSDILVPGISAVNLQRDPNGLVSSATRSVPRPAGLTDIRSRSFEHDLASQVKAFQYDALGRRTIDGNRSYQWSLAGRLNGYDETTSQASFTYDAVGLRTGRSRAGDATEYVWNYALRLPSVSVQRRNGGDERYFVYTPAGDLLYSIEADGSRRFYHFDENGNTLYLTGNGGAVVASYAYSPYGEMLAKSGSIDNPFTFLGQRGVMQEDDSGLYYMRARYYDASSARFLSRDSVQGTTPTRINPYQYAQGNPLLFRDPTGMTPEEESDSWMPGFVQDAVNAASDLISGGFGVMNVVGANWAHVRNVAKHGFKETIQKTDDALESMIKRGRATIHHIRAAEDLRTRARIPAPATPLGDIAASTKWAIFGGLVSAAIENTQDYVSTTAGSVMARIGVGGVNTAASFNPASALFVGISSIVDAGTGLVFDARLGAHEILNTPFRFAAALEDDVLFEGRSIFNSRSSTSRFAHDLLNNRGGLSKGIAWLGTPGEMLVEHTPVGDLMAWSITMAEVEISRQRNLFIGAKDEVVHFFRTIGTDE